MGMLALGLLVAIAACVATVALDAAMVAAIVKPSGLLGDWRRGGGLPARGGRALRPLFRARGLAAGVSFGITVVFYLLWVIGGLSDHWTPIKDFSVFTVYPPQKALESGAMLPPAFLRAGRGTSPDRWSQCL